tara:strand:- start:2019 stop:2282 length:264 start_codon:yes stop_codon:yes gene_type:complete
MLTEESLKRYNQARLDELNFYNEKISSGAVLSEAEKLAKSQIEAQLNSQARRRSDEDVGNRLAQQQEARIDQLERQLRQDSINASQG